MPAHAPPQRFSKHVASSGSASPSPPSSPPRKDPTPSRLKLSQSRLNTKEEYGSLRSTQRAQDNSRSRSEAPPMQRTATTPNPSASNHKRVAQAQRSQSWLSEYDDSSDSLHAIDESSFEEDRKASSPSDDCSTSGFILLPGTRNAPAGMLPVTNSPSSTPKMKPSSPPSSPLRPSSPLDANGNRVMCRYGDKCTNGSCRFAHAPPSPPPAPAPAPGTFTGLTLAVDCKYGRYCNRQDCPFDHAFSRKAATAHDVPHEFMYHPEATDQQLLGSSYSRDFYAPHLAHSGDMDFPLTTSSSRFYF